MTLEREALEHLLSQYKNARFNPVEVEALLKGEKLPPTASPTLLDVEQSIRPWGETVNSPIKPGSSGNDNTE